MKNKRFLNAVLTILVLVTLTLLSRYSFETMVLFGGLYLLKSQAGGIKLRLLLSKGIAIFVIWLVGTISYSIVCPVWLLYLFLLLANVTIYLFAPATNQIDLEQKRWTELMRQREIRRQKKNRAVFLTGFLSLAALITHGKPLSSILLIILLTETVSILGVILEALQKQFRDIS